MAVSAAKREELAALDSALTALVAETTQQGIVTTIRQVFYRAVSARLIPKTERAYKQVARRLLKLRHAGTVPWQWIADPSRSSVIWHSHSGPDGDDFAQAVQNIYRRDRWDSLGIDVQVWVESRSIAQVVRRTCATHSANLYPAGGQPSDSFLWAAGRDFAVRDAARKVVLYLGDYDDVGLDIRDAVKEKLPAFVALHDGHADDWQFVPLAVTAEQASRLPSHPSKTTRRVQFAVEAEAMPAEEMCELLADWFTANTPPGHFDMLDLIEQEEKRDIRSLIRHGALVAPS